VFPKRDAFRFQVLPSDRQLWAIGMVTVTWSHLEGLLQVCAQSLAGEGSEDARLYEATRSFKLRLEILERLSSRLRQPYRSSLEHLLVDIRNAQQQRDRIVHSSWGGDAVRTDGPQATGAFNHFKPHPAFEWTLDFGGIKAVAVRIDAITRQLFELIIDGTTGPTLLSDALKAKMAK